MGKRGKVINPKRFSRNRGVASDDMDDEIDAFHKQRDIIPLDANGDIVDSDDEIPVFDLKGMNDDEDEDDETGDIAKMARTQKYLREKFGGVKDAMHEDEEEQEPLWVGKRKGYYDADNADYEAQSSDDEGLLREEEVVLKLRMQKSYTNEDSGHDVNEDWSDLSDRELTVEEMSAKRKSRKKSPGIKEALDDTGSL